MISILVHYSFNFYIRRNLKKINRESISSKKSLPQLKKVNKTCVELDQRGEGGIRRQTDTSHKRNSSG